MTSETDEEFMERMLKARAEYSNVSAIDADRLFAIFRRGVDAAARIERLEAALREIMGMDEVAIVDFKKGDGWLHQRVASAALAAPSGALEGK